MDKVKLMLLACVLAFGCAESEHMRTNSTIGWTDSNGNIEFKRTVDESLNSFKANLMEHFKKEGYKPIEGIKNRDSIQVKDNIIIYHIDTVMDSTLFLSINYEFNPPIATTTDTLYNGNIGLEFSYNPNGTGPVFVIAAVTCAEQYPCRCCVMKKGKCDCTQTYENNFCCCEKQTLSIQDPVVWSFL